MAICFGDKIIQVALDGCEKAIRVLLEIDLDLQINQFLKKFTRFSCTLFKYFRIK